MRPKRSLADPAVVTEVIARVSRLTPDNHRQWGTMTPPEVLCHLADSFHAVLGERAFSGADPTLLTSTVVKWIAIHTTVPWPQGVPTRPEIDSHIKGTRPGAFEQDRAAVIALIRRFTLPETRYDRHPAFGRMTRNEWLLWGSVTSTITCASLGYEPA
jgi:hypothetical protein